MKNTLAAAVLAILAQGAWGQVSFDGAGRPSLPSFRVKAPAIAHSISPEAKMAQGAKASVVNILVVIKWASVPASKLPLDPKKVPPDIAGMLQFDPGAAKDFAAKHPSWRVSRADLPTYQTIASGSGFVVKASNGELVLITNHHVVDTDKIAQQFGAKPELHVKPSNDQFAVMPFDNDVIAQVGATGKRGMDIAFLKIPPQRADGSAWDTLTLGDSSKVQEGEDVWAMGFPMALNFTMTKGIVSAVHETLDDPYVSYIQTDAPINPGNSGGPLVRIDGPAGAQHVEVIGMDTMILSNNEGGGEGGSIGLGFAIESNTIKRALKMYINTGSIDVGYVGMMFGRAQGAVSDQVSVQSVAPGSPAEKAGLQAGDVIESVGGQTVSNNAEVAEIQISRGVKAKDPGGTVILVVKRGGQDVTINIVVEKEPASLEQPSEDTK